MNKSGNKSLKIAIIGCGSIGKRHLRNVKSLLEMQESTPKVNKELSEKKAEDRSEVIAFDTSEEALNAVRQEYGVRTSTDIDAVLKEADGVFICTPNHLHATLALKALQNDCQVLIEKPLSHNLQYVDQLLRLAAEKKLTLTVGYMLQFYPPLQMIKKLLEQEAIGKVYSVLAEFGSYLPSWRPTQDYRKNYGAIRSQGGGVILDVIHEINYLSWLFGPAQEIYCSAHKLSSLEMDTEDSAEIIMKTAAGIVVNLHLDYLQKAYSRKCRIIGSKGIIEWNFGGHTVKIYLDEKKEWETLYADEKMDFNQIYIEEERHFLQCVGEKIAPKISAKEAKDDLLTALAALESAEKKKTLLVQDRHRIGARIYVRELELSDATEKYQGWLRDPEVIKFLAVRNLTLDEIKSFIQEKKNNPFCILWGIFDRRNDAHLGNIKVEPIERSVRKATVGLLIGEKEYWNKGYGSEAMGLIIDYCFNYLGLEELNLGVAAEHAAAIAMYEKLGFKKEKINPKAARCGEQSYDQLIMVKKRYSEKTKEQQSDIEIEKKEKIEKRERIEIIAEIAQGYEGNPFLAKLLAKGAIRSGADAIKFQLVYADELATADYHYYSLFKKLEMEDSEWKEITAMIHQAGKKIYFDVYGTKSLQLAGDLHADGIKLSTTEFYNTDLMDAALQAGFKRILISLGGIPLSDIQEFLHREPALASLPIFFLVGFQSEPTPLESNNLNRIQKLQVLFPQLKFGFMDHSLGTSEDALYLPLVSIGTGIHCIEKHLSLDPMLEIEDFVSALTPEKFQEFVRLVRKYEAALGSSSLELSPLEIEYRKKAVKIVVALEDIPPGTMLSRKKVALKRIGARFSKTQNINRLETALDRRNAVFLQKDEPVGEGDLQ